MSTPIGFSGLAYSAKPSGPALTFAADASAVKVTGLDPAKSYDIFFSVAGPSDVTIHTTSDSPAAIAAGIAVWGAAKAYTTVAADGYGGMIAAGATAVKVTHAKNGAGTDSAPVVAALGGRFQARFVAKLASATVDAAAADQGTYGDYTALS